MCQPTPVTERSVQEQLYSVSSKLYYAKQKVEHTSPAWLRLDQLIGEVNALSKDLETLY
jgi:hypothetical protein